MYNSPRMSKEQCIEKAFFEALREAPELPLVEMGDRGNWQKKVRSGRYLLSQQSKQCFPEAKCV